MTHQAPPLVAIVDLTRDRPERQAFQRLAGGLAESMRRLAAEHYRVRMVYTDELTTDGLIQQTADADVVVFLGGEDVAPSFYGGSEDYEGMGAQLAAEDGRQIELIRRLVAERTPTLGVCRGAQIVNVALGGTLVQHLEVPGHRNPQILKDLRLATHDVELSAGSRLAEAFAGEAGKHADVTVSVQSAHHQAIDVPGAGLKVVGRADDGVIEAVEHETAPLIAVQWHPEDPNTDGEQVTILLRSLLQG